ncbi:hypothetical protein B0H11DRAFT_2206522 [Mycena galericulata]|nr:hypothetical protein B0H11DRAFT_2206522 [Mycena galericulata]
MLNTAHKYIGTVPIVDAIPANIEGVMRQCLAYEPRSAPRAFEPCSERSSTGYATSRVRDPSPHPRRPLFAPQYPPTPCPFPRAVRDPEYIQSEALLGTWVDIAYSDSSTLMDFIIIIGIHAAIQTFYIPTTGQLVPPPHSGDHGIQCRAYPQLLPLCPFMSRSYLSAEGEFYATDRGNFKITKQKELQDNKAKGTSR